MGIKPVVFSLILGAAVHTFACAQSTTASGFVSRTELGVVYTYLRSNSIPANAGQSSGFAMSGISATGAYRVRPHLSAVLDFSGTHVNGVENTGLSLTMLTYLVGGRYSIRPTFHVKPFAQVLLGEVHATGGIYPAVNSSSGGADSFAMTGGGGVDYPLSHILSLRAQADYLFTGLPNGSTNRQSDLRLGAGLVVHFGNQ